MNPYLFIVGCPRSGTTLLRRMVDAHPQIAITRETHWIPELAETGREQLAESLAGHPKSGTLGIEREEIERLAAGTPSYAAFVGAVFDRYGAAKGKPLVGDKTPGYVRELPLLHRLFPAARFVHLVRDGRDVCLSALGWERKAEQFRRRYPTWDEAPVASAARWWRAHVLDGRRAPLPGALYHELRYEALVADPAGTLRELCGFLEVEYDAAMVRFHEGRTKQEPGLSAKRAWLPPTPGLRDWRSQMTPEQLEEFETAAGDALDELGYERRLAAPERER